VGVFRFLRTVPVLLILGGGFAGAYIGVDGLIGANHAKAAMARQGGDPASLLHATHLIPALNAVGDKAGNEALLRRLTIYPGYLVADVVAGHGQAAESVRVQDDGDVRVLPAPDVADHGTVALADVDPHAVESMAREAARREHTDLDGVHDAIVAVDPPSRKQRITAYLDDEHVWEAQLDGGGLRRAAGR
jgi:hypothetical protein